MNLMKKTLLSASAVLLLAACGDGTVEEPGGNQPGEVETSDSMTEQDTSSTADTSAKDEGQNDSQGQGIQGREFEVSFAQALEILNETFGEVNVEQVQFDRDDNRYVYDIEAHDETSEYSLVIDAETGDIVEQDEENDNDNDNDIINIDNVITPLDAMDIAMQEASDGAYVKEWDLDTDNGRAIYEIEVENGEDFEIDAETGDILERD